MRILSVVGARPNFMKIAPVVSELRRVPEVEDWLVHTGQHYDQKLSGKTIRAWYSRILEAFRKKPRFWEYRVYAPQEYRTAGHSGKANKPDCRNGQAPGGGGGAKSPTRRFHTGSNSTAVGWKSRGAIR